MDTDDWTTLQTVSYRHEAEMIRSLLAGSGIECLIQGDDVGGLRPDIGYVQGVQILVRVRDLYSARQLLEPEDEEKPQ